MSPPRLASTDPVELGRALAGARRSRNLSQEEVARHLGVSRPTVVAIEKGTRPPRSSEIVALAELFGRSVHELLTRPESVSAFAPQFRLTQAVHLPEQAVAKAVEEFRRICEDYLALEALVDA